ncbi:MAG: hypothetical protein ABR508_09495 [Candidatus Baltobacteraceae bacterium]
MAAGLASGPLAQTRVLFAFAGRTLAVDVRDEPSAEILNSTYGALRSDPARTAHHTAALRRMGDGRLHVRFDRRVLSTGEGASPSPLLSSYYALKEVFARFSAAVPGSLAFYGASVTIDGAAVMLIGPSYSGKTVLALQLAANGALLLGDETVCLDLRAGMARALARLPALREAALPFLPAAMRASIEQSQRVVQTARGRFWYGLGAQDLGGIKPAERDHRLRAIFILRDRGEEPQARASDPERSLPTLLQRAYSRPFQLLEVAAAKRALRNVAVFDLQTGRPQETAELIVRTVRACA